MPIVDGNYVSPTWVNGQAPAINAQELNALCGTVQQNQSDIQTLKNTVYITRTASGNPATFSDGANNLPIISLVATISPSQSGSGDPSPTNVRPISGTDQITFYVNDDEFSIVFPVGAGTVYGGTLDVINGVLTVNMARVDMGTLEYSYRQSSGGVSHFWGNPPGIIVGVLGEKAILCSGYKAIPCINVNVATGNTFPNNCICQSVAGYTIRIRDDNYTDVDTFKTAVSGVQLVYTLATPITYQLTPHEVNTLLGSNTIYTGSAFPVTVTYKGDPSLVVQALEQRITKTQSIIAGVEASTTASKNYSIGNLLIQGDKLYKVTSAIANGAEIIVGTNVAATTVAEQLLLLA